MQIFLTLSGQVNSKSGLGRKANIIYVRPHISTSNSFNPTARHCIPSACPSQADEQMGSSLRGPAPEPAQRT